MTETLKLKSLTTFLSGPVHSSIDPFDRPIAFQLEDNPSKGNRVLNIFGGKTRSYQPMLQSKEDLLLYTINSSAEVRGSMP